MTFDEKIKQAIAEDHEEYFGESYGISEKHRFSISYKLCQAKKFINYGKNISARDPKAVRRLKYVLVAVAVAVVLGTTAFAATSIGRFSFSKHSNYSQLFMENISSDKKIIEEYYGLPETEGWVITEYYADEESSLILYDRGDTHIDVGQEIIDRGVHHINTEYADPEPLSLYEPNDGIYVDQGGGETSIYWIYDGYLFYLGGNIDKDEAVNLAYSLKIIDLEKNL